MTDKPFRALPPDNFAPLLELLKREVADIEGRLDPTLLRLSAHELARLAVDGEVWQIASPPRGCIVLTPLSHALHIGRIAVAAEHRGKGFGRGLVDLAETRARALRRPALEVLLRVEQASARAFYAAVGFTVAAEIRHPGEAQPHAVTLQRAV